MQNSPVPALVAEDLVKTYPGGRARPPYARSTGSRSRSAAARSSACSARTAPASPPPSRSSPRCPGRTPAGHGRRLDVAPRRRIASASRSAGRPQKSSQRPDGHRPGKPRARRPDPGHVPRQRRRRGPTSCWTGSGSRTRPTGWPRPTPAGWRRKLDVAIGLMHRPRVLFLDEPTTGLDPEARAECGPRSAGLSADEQVTVLLTTHYLEEADRLADRLAIVDHGRVVVEGTPEELKSELRGDTVQVELGVTRTRRPAAAAACWLGVPGLREITRRRHPRCGHGPTAARAPSPPCSPRSRTRGIDGRARSRSPGRRSTTSTCATRVAVSRTAA